MKCSDYRKLCAQVRGIEFSELKRAVEAHGGLYRFDEDERPVVMMNRDFGPEDVSVCQVSVNESGYLCMTGIPKEDISEIEVDPDEVAIGHVDFIISAIPPCCGVEDVTRQTVGSLAHDPEVVAELAATLVPSLVGRGVVRSKAISDVLALAARLTESYAGVDWQEKDFWETIDGECDRFLNEWDEKHRREDLKEPTAAALIAGKVNEMQEGVLADIRSALVLILKKAGGAVRIKEHPYLGYPSIYASHARLSIPQLKGAKIGENDTVTLLTGNGPVKDPTASMPVEELLQVLDTLEYAADNNGDFLY